MTQSSSKYVVIDKIVVNENSGICNGNDTFGQRVVHNNIKCVNKDGTSQPSFLIYCNLHKKMSDL